MWTKRIRRKPGCDGFLLSMSAVGILLLLCGETPAQTLYDQPQSEVPPPPINRTEDPLGRKDLRVLSLREAIYTTLEHNLDIAVQRINPEIREQDIIVQKSAFDPVFSYNFRQRGRDVPTASASPSRTWFTPTGAVFVPDWDIVTAQRSGSTTMSAQLAKKTITGADVTVGYDYSRQNSTTSFSLASGTPTPSFNPTYAPDLVFTLNQPLLKGAGIDYNQRGIKIATMNKKGARETYVWQIMGTALEAQENYWQLVSRIRQLGIERESLRRAKRLLADNRARLRVGTMSRADVIEAEAQVAQQQQRIIAAQYDLLIAENNLKKTLNDPDLTVLTETAIVPRDQPTSEPRKIDWVYCVDRALNMRPDYKAIMAQLEANKIDIKRRKNELYPEIDLQASLTVNGLGDTFPWAMDVLSPFSGNGFFDAFVGVNVTVPLGGNRAAKATYRQAQLTAAQTLRGLKNAELEIIRQVREAVRYVENYLEVIAASKTVTELRARQLEAKEIKRKAGTGIPFEVVQAQDDLVQAEGAELVALINYNLWLARLSYRMGTILEELDVEVEEKPTTNMR